MRHVKEYKININKNNLPEPKINIPISLISSMSNQEEVVNRDFVNVEVEKAINEIIDYEKVKLIPINENGITKLNSLTYKINILNDEVFNYDTKWSDIGFDDDDFKFKKNGFVKTFVRLDFYDSDNNSDQRLLFFTTLFPKITKGEFTIQGNFPSPTNYNLNFNLADNSIDRDLNTEGFSLYYYKDEILPTINTDVYMKATLLNAKTGEVINMMSSNDLNLSIDELLTTNKLHTKYTLIRDEVMGYSYYIDSTYSSNITYSNNSGVINLYEIKTT